MALLVNTRQYRRFAAKLMIKITSGSLSFWAITSNISQKGLCIRANQEFPVNKVLDIELIMPDGQISTIKGTVKHVNESPQSQRRFGIGIEIIEDDTTFRNYLHNLEEKTVLPGTHKAEAVYNTQDMGKDPAAARASGTPDIIRTSHQMSTHQKDEELCEQVPSEEPEKELRKPVHTTGPENNPSRSKQGRGGKTRALPAFLMILLAIGIVTAGIVLYRGFMQDRNIQPAKDLICSIQVGSFRSHANAQVLLQKYQDKGHTVFIDTSDIKGKGIMYKVLIGPFQHINDTSRVAEDIRAQENIDPFVTCK